jgi:hypothetical protein
VRWAYPILTALLLGGITWFAIWAGIRAGTLHDNDKP